MSPRRRSEKKSLTAAELTEHAERQWGWIRALGVFAAVVVFVSSLATVIISGLIASNLLNKLDDRDAQIEDLQAQLSSLESLVQDSEQQNRENFGILTRSFERIVLLEQALKDAGITVPDSSQSGQPQGGGNTPPQRGGTNGGTQPQGGSTTTTTTTTRPGEPPPTPPPEPPPNPVRDLCRRLGLAELCPV